MGFWSGLSVGFGVGVLAGLLVTVLCAVFWYGLIAERLDRDIVANSISTIKKVVRESLRQWIINDFRGRQDADVESLPEETDETDDDPADWWKRP